MSYFGINTLDSYPDSVLICGQNIPAEQFGVDFTETTSEIKYKYQHLDGRVAHIVVNYYSKTIHAYIVDKDGKAVYDVEKKFDGQKNPYTEIYFTARDVSDFLGGTQI